MGNDSNISIFGLGYVGLPLAIKLSNYFNVSRRQVRTYAQQMGLTFSQKDVVDSKVMVYDIDKTKSQHPLSDVFNESDYIFVSVPTPANPEGSINLEIVFDLATGGECSRYKITRSWIGNNGGDSGQPRTFFAGGMWDTTAAVHSVGYGVRNGTHDLVRSSSLSLYGIND